MLPDPVHEMLVCNEVVKEGLGGEAISSLHVREGDDMPRLVGEWREVLQAAVRGQRPGGRLSPSTAR